MQISKFGLRPQFDRPRPGPGDPLPPPDQGDLSPAAAKIARIQNLLNGITTRWDERRILDILRQCGPQELNEVLSGTDLLQLSNDVDDHWFGPKNKQALYQLLTEERLGDLTVETRARLIHGLQAGDTHRSDERAVRNVLLGTRSGDLTALKLRIDQSEDHRDLHQLMFHDMDHTDYKQQILSHIAKEAGPAQEFKLLSDIDDTFYCNWKDQRFPKGSVYPGVRQYYKEMDAAPAGQPDDLTFVTARPDDRIGAVKRRTKKSLRQKGLGQMVVLAGSVPSLFSNEALAAKKFERMGQLNQLYPEFRLVFTGDSGQGDALCGLKLNQANWPVYSATLIHDVVQSSPEERQRYREQRVYFFDTYVGAALEAQSLGLMSRDAARRVGQAASSDFGQTAFVDEAQRSARLAELQADLDRLNQDWPPDQQVEVGPLAPLSSIPMPEIPELPNSG